MRHINFTHASLTGTGLVIQRTLQQVLNGVAQRTTTNKLRGKQLRTDSVTTSDKSVIVLFYFVGLLLFITHVFIVLILPAYKWLPTFAADARGLTYIT